VFVSGVLAVLVNILDMTVFQCDGFSSGFRRKWWCASCPLGVNYLGLMSYLSEFSGVGCRFDPRKEAESMVVVSTSIVVLSVFDFLFPCAAFSVMMVIMPFCNHYPFGRCFVFGTISFSFHRDFSAVCRSLTLAFW